MIFQKDQVAYIKIFKFYWVDCIHGQRTVNSSHAGQNESSIDIDPPYCEKLTLLIY